MTFLQAGGEYISSWGQTQVLKSGGVVKLFKTI